MSQAGILNAASSNPAIPTSFLLDDTNTAVAINNQIIVHGVGGATTSLGLANEINITAGGGSSPLTTKGDLYTFSTVNARLPVGANSTILMADSAQTTGNKWTTATYPTDAAAGDLIYGSATHAFSTLSGPSNPSQFGAQLSWNGTLPVWSTLDNYFYAFEEFLDPQPDYGVFGFHHFVNGTATITQIPSTATNFGINRVGIGTNNDIAIVYMNANAFYLGMGKSYISSYVTIPIASNGTDTFTCYMGITDSNIPSASVKSIFFSADQNSHANWQINTSNGVSITTVDSGVAVSNANYQLLTIFTNAAGTSATFYINGSNVGTISTTFPTNQTYQIYAAAAKKTAGGNAAFIYIDYFTMFISFTSARP